MGLDLLEMVMAVEERFRISIPDKDLGAIRTFGGLKRYVLSRVEGESTRASSDAVATAPRLVVGANGAKAGSFAPIPTTCPSLKSFVLIRRSLIARGVPRERVTLDVPVSELLPPMSRAEALRYSSELGLVLPDPRQDRFSLAFVVFVGFAILSFCLSTPAETVVVCSLAALVLALWVMTPALVSSGTLRDLIQAVVILNVWRFDSIPAFEAEVDRVLRQIVSDYAGRDPDAILDTDRFYEDLKIG